MIFTHKSAPRMYVIGSSAHFDCFKAINLVNSRYTSSQTRVHRATMSFRINSRYVFGRGSASKCIWLETVPRVPMSSVVKCRAGMHWQSSLFRRVGIIISEFSPQKRNTNPNKCSFSGFFEPRHCSTVFLDRLFLSFCAIYAKPESRSPHASKTQRRWLNSTNWSLKNGSFF